MKNKGSITLFLLLIFILFAFFVIRKYFPYHKEVIAASSCNGNTTMTDTRDTPSTVYDIVQIGTQCWMAENLNYGTRINGDGSSGIRNQANDSVVEKYCWNDNSSNCATYGGYYQWHEAVQLPGSCDDTNCSGSVGDPRRGICPSGWHIPSDGEWYTLENYLQTSGSCSSSRNDSWGCSTAGTKMKAGGSSGLNIGIFGSIMENGDGWIDMGVDGHYWTSGSLSNSDDPNRRTWGRDFEPGQSGVKRKPKEKRRGFPVRCVKNPTPPTPTPTTPIPTPTSVPCQVRTSPATLNLSAGGTGTVTASVISGLGGASITRIRFGSYNTSIATVTPNSDISSPYSTTVRGVSGGSTAVWGTADLSDGRTCPSSASDDTNVNVTYTISGNVFNDINKNKQKDTFPPPGESNYAAVPGISINPDDGTINTFPNGTYTVSNLPAGTYTVRYTSLPVGDGYFMIWPQFASYVVTVGSSCDINSIVPVPLGASCTADNVINLNFAISNSMPWVQTYGLDIRVDNGFDNPQPASTTCGGGSFASGVSGSFISPGIVFTGDTTAEFGQGSSSTTDWVVGGSSYPEVFTNVSALKTSTQNLRAAAERAGIEPEPLNNVSGCGNPTANCNLPNNLEKGVYYYDGDIHFEQPINNSFQAGNTYVFLAENNHNIYFENNASSTVPFGALVFFAAAGDIIIDKDVHAASNSCPVPVGQLQGVFSADNNITIEGNNGICTAGADKMLNIDGSLIANATQGSGIFKNNRDLCGGNPTYPSITIKARPDFILNTPGFLREPNIVSQEETP